MGTSESPLDWFLERTPATEISALAPGDATRLSIEAFIAKSASPETELPFGSRGQLRLHGDGVMGHSAELAHVGAIATNWQKAVSAIGAALENVKSLRGSLPSEIQARTALVLTASPGPGSIILDIEPKPSVLPVSQGEVGQDQSALADRASDRLIAVLGGVTEAQLDQVDESSEMLRELGPRVGGSLAQLATAVIRSGITVDASWREPRAATKTAVITPSKAEWIRRIVTGRRLDVEEEIETMVGTIRTVSDTERWLIQLEDSIERMDARELDSGAYADRRVGETVSLTVRVTLQEQSDGSTRRSFSILSVAPSSDS
jgi:hypothetical protein